MASNQRVATLTANRPELSEEQLEACRQGDRQALHQLYETYKNRVYTLARRFSGDESLAWDLTQEVFLKLFSRLSEFRRESKFDTWLFRIVVNACVTAHRNHKRWVRLGPEIEMNQRTETELQETSVIRKQLATRVQAAIARLSPAVRLPILLRYVEGLSYAEIANLLGCRKGTVAARLYRGHKTLAKDLAALRGEAP